MRDLARAVALLAEGYTLVCCRGDEIDTDTARGVAPLLARLDANKKLAGWSVADRVVGNGAAFLYVILGVSRLYARVLSRPALATLRAYQIPVTYDNLVDCIENRTHTGRCPMEMAVEGCTTPAAAEAAIRTAYANLTNRGDKQQ